MIDRRSADSRQIPSWPPVFALALSVTALASSCILPSLDATRDGEGGSDGSGGSSSSTQSSTSSSGGGGDTSVGQGGAGGSSVGPGGGGAGGSSGPKTWAPANWSGDFMTEGTPSKGQLDLAAWQDRVFVAGSVVGNYKLPGGPPMILSSYDAFVGAYSDQVGAPPLYLWSQATGSVGDERGIAVAANTPGFALLGTFSGTIASPAGSLTNAPMSGNYDIFIAENSHNMAFGWTAQLENQTPDYLEFTPTALAMGPTGTVVAVGLVAGTMTRTGGPGNTVSSADPMVSDIFVAKTDVLDTFTEIMTIGGASSWRTVSAVAMDGQQIYVSGRFSGQMTVLGTTLNASAPSVTDTFLLAIASDDAKLTWAVTIPGETSDDRQSLVARSGGGVALAGSFTDIMETPCMTLTSNSPGLLDAYVIAFDPFGGCEWAQRIGGPGDDRAVDMAQTPDLDLVLTGSSLSADDGLLHVLLAKLDKNGLIECTGTFGDSNGNQEGRAIAVPSFTGSVFVAGSLEGTIELVPGMLLSGGAGRNAFLARFPADTCQ